MSLDSLDPEAGDDGDAGPLDDIFCPALNGIGPHNYQPYLDLVSKATFLYCNQCGDVMAMTDPLPSSSGFPSLFGPPGGSGGTGSGSSSAPPPTKSPTFP